MAGKDPHQKDLRKLGKMDLLELLIEQSRENLALKERLAKAEAELENRRILIEESGSLAEAALKLSGIFEAAQKAIEIYRENYQKDVKKKLADADEGSEDPAAAEDHEGKEETE